MKRFYQYISIFIAFDFLSGFTAWILFFYARKFILNETFVDVSLQLILRASVIGLFWLFLYYISSFYSSEIFRKSRLQEIVNLLKTSIFGTIIIFFVLLLDDEGVQFYKVYYKTFSSYFIIHIIVSIFFKLFVVSFFHSLVKKGTISFNTLVIGGGERALQVMNEIENENKHLGLKILGYVNGLGNKNGIKFPSKCHYFGDYSLLEDIIRKNEIEEVIIAIEQTEHRRLEAILTLLDNVDVKVKIIPDLYQILIGTVKISNLIGTPLIEIDKQLLPYWQKAIKRLADILISLIVLLIGTPFFIIIALLIKRSSKGPIFYSQKRIGLNAQSFQILKFRSMYIDSEKCGPALSFKDDPRITSFGKYMRKTRIDELPQFLNVLIGDMSLVGPRPERQYFIEKICEQADYYRHLQKVKPGITSLGQVKYGYAENVEQMVQRLKFDILYIENMSLSMDFRILMFTILIVLQGKGK